MKAGNNNRRKTAIAVMLIITIITIPLFYSFRANSKQCHISHQAAEVGRQPGSKGCVFNTLMGVVPLDSNFVLETTDDVLSSIESGLAWISKAQHPNGGWGAGMHAQQDILDPHAVSADPATTAMVGMALLRTGNSLESGQYSEQLARAVNYILETVESLEPEDIYITEIRGTQIQRKLGQHIDAVLSSQFLTNISNDLGEEHALKTRINAAIGECVSRIQLAQNTDGSLSGSGWAGVLQSGYAVNAVESAQQLGIVVDEIKLEQSRNYQVDNVDASTGSVDTEDGAGIMLYSVSGSSRASAKKARKAREAVEQAKSDGLLEKEDDVNPENLEKIGYSKSEALTYGTSYEVYSSASKMANQNSVRSGFGNNGGEEFLSFLQTGESMIINKDIAWKDWYANASGDLLHIQNQDGSWNGHHCITSPVFCTATCLLVLSVNNDLEELVALGVD